MNKFTHEKAIVYILGYPFVKKSQIFNSVFHTETGVIVNYFIFDGELFETWEIGQLLGGN